MTGHLVTGDRGWSRVVTTIEQAKQALADPGSALDLRAPVPPEPEWLALGFAPLVPGELVLPVPQVLRRVDQTRALGVRLAAALRAGDLLVLSGPLGAGKTALAQGIGAGLGVRGPVTSPTFVLARVHRGAVPLVHVDGYRLRQAGAGPRAVDDLDLDADLPFSVTVVEWGEGLVEHLADSRLDVRLERPGPGETRRATVRAYGARWARAGDARTRSGHAASTDAEEGTSQV